jgi:uracil phosphoribosyltransferase
MSERPDSAYRHAHFVTSELTHHYGPNVHILSDPLALTQLARLCQPVTEQPLFNQLISSLYLHLLRTVINAELPRRTERVATRMAASTPRAVLETEYVDRTTRLVVVDIARAGILPSQVCFDFCNTILEPSGVRCDHLVMSRTTNEAQQVSGALISGGKIGGPIGDRVVILPDPMGATGTSLVTAISHYKQQHPEAARKWITMNLIVTPEFIRAMHKAHPEVIIYALRLDRGMSPPDVLASVPGQFPDEESGLNDHDYIVPGGGGFGELMNNAFV